MSDKKNWLTSNARSRVAYQLFLKRGASPGITATASRLFAIKQAKIDLKFLSLSPEKMPLNGFIRKFRLFSEMVL
jgi:hypothetical protein